MVPLRRIAGIFDRPMARSYGLLAPILGMRFAWRAGSDATLDRSFSALWNGLGGNAEYVVMPSKKPFTKPVSDDARLHLTVKKRRTAEACGQRQRISATQSMATGDGLNACFQV